MSSRNILVIECVRLTELCKLIPRVENISLIGEEVVTLLRSSALA